MASNKPKVVGSYAAGAVTVVLVWLWPMLVTNFGAPELTAEVAAILGVAVTGSWGWIKRAIDQGMGT